VRPERAPEPMSAHASMLRKVLERRRRPACASKESDVHFIYLLFNKRFIDTTVAIDAGYPLQLDHLMLDYSQGSTIILLTQYPDDSICLHVRNYFIDWSHSKPLKSQPPPYQGIISIPGSLLDYSRCRINSNRWPIHLVVAVAA
jgi:hypothetical protein